VEDISTLCSDFLRPVSSLQNMLLSEPPRGYLRSSPYGVQMQRGVAQVLDTLAMARVLTVEGLSMDSPDVDFGGNLSNAGPGAVSENPVSNARRRKPLWGGSGGSASVPNTNAEQAPANGEAGNPPASVAAPPGGLRRRWFAYELLSIMLKLGWDSATACAFSLECLESSALSTGAWVSPYPADVGCVRLCLEAYRLFSQLLDAIVEHLRHGMRMQWGSGGALSLNRLGKEGFDQRVASLQEWMQGLHKLGETVSAAAAPGEYLGIGGTYAFGVGKSGGVNGSREGLGVGGLGSSLLGGSAASTPAAPSAAGLGSAGQPSTLGRPPLGIPTMSAGAAPSSGAPTPASSSAFSTVGGGVGFAGMPTPVTINRNHFSSGTTTGSSSSLASSFETGGLASTISLRKDAPPKTIRRFSHIQ